MLKKVYHICPSCGMETTLMAKEEDFSRPECLVPVVSNNGEKDYLWDQAEIEANLVYYCSECGEVIDVNDEELFPQEEVKGGARYVTAHDTLKELVLKHVHIDLINEIMMRLHDVEITSMEEAIKYLMGTEYKADHQFDAEKIVIETGDDEIAIDETATKSIIQIHSMNDTHSLYVIKDQCGWTENKKGVPVFTLTVEPIEHSTHEKLVNWDSAVSFYWEIEDINNINQTYNYFYKLTENDMKNILKKIQENVDWYTGLSSDTVADFIEEYAKENGIERE